MYDGYTISPLMFLIERGKDLVVAELGVLFGDTTLTILNKCSVKKYYAVDLWDNYDGYDDDLWGIPEIMGRSGDLQYKRFKERVENFPHVVTIRETTHKAHRHIEDGELDFCFIDANHSYDYAYKDIELYLPKIKKGGIICGDDYRLESVKEAVTDFFKNTEYKVNDLFNSWWVRK